MKLKRKKVGDQKYHLVNEDGRAVAEVVKTGTHLDDYPWDWRLLPGVYYTNPLRADGVSLDTQGVADALYSAVDVVESYLNHYGLEPYVTHWRAIEQLAKNEKYLREGADRAEAEIDEGMSGRSEAYRQIELESIAERREWADEYAAAIAVLKAVDE